MVNLIPPFIARELPAEILGMPQALFGWALLASFVFAWLLYLTLRSE